MAEAAAAADGYTTVGKSGKPTSNKSNNGVNKIISKEEDIVLIRVEHIESANEYGESSYNIAAATDGIIKSIINGNDKIKLLSIDKTKQINSMETFGSTKVLNQYVKTAEAEAVNKRSVRFTALFMLRTNVEFSDIVKMTTVKKALNEWKWIMYNHHLSFDHVEAKLVFNIFKMNPYCANKAEVEKTINNKIRNFIKDDASTDMKNKLSDQFCKWAIHGKDNIVEIGKRLWKSDFIDETNDEERTVQSEILVIRCCGHLSPKIKDVIKAIKWEEREFGIFIEENPTLNDSSQMIQLAHMHNHLCKLGAYVKVTQLPKKSLDIKLREYKDKTVTQVILEQKIPGTRTGEFLFGSINCINEKKGTYYITTTIEQLEYAEITFLDITGEFNDSNEHKENMKSIVDDPIIGVGITQRDAPSVTGSQVSKFINEDNYKPLDMTQEYMKKEYSTSSNKIGKKINKRGNRSYRGKTKEERYQYDNASPTTTDHIPKVISTKKNSKQTTTTLPQAFINESSVGNPKEESTLTPNPSSEPTMPKPTNDEIKKLQEKIEQMEKEIARLQVMEDRAKRADQLEEEILHTKQQNDSLITQAYEQQQKIKEYEAKDTAYEATANQLFPESPMPEHKGKRSKNEVSGTKRISMTTDRQVRFPTIDEGKEPNDPNEIQMDTEETTQDQKFKTPLKNNIRTEKKSSLASALEQDPTIEEKIDNDDFQEHDNDENQMHPEESDTSGPCL